MNSMVMIEHPELSVGQLCQEIRNPTAPIKRSTHVGNQPPHELLLMTEFPTGIGILMVDTIQGNDRYSLPRDIILDRERVLLCSKQEASGRVVGSIAVSKDEVPEDLDLCCEPEFGESLSAFHSRAINLLKPNNAPETMSAHFARHPSILRTALNQIHLHGETMCRVDDTGRISICGDESVDQVGVFGMNDESPPTEGLLPPLNGMMVIDMLISAVALDSDKTIHLAGPDMIRYTRDRTRMENVGMIIGKTAAELGVLVSNHCYQVVDITGLKRVVPTATHASQHQLLRARSVVNVDLDKHADEPCGSI